MDIGRIAELAGLDTHYTSESSAYVWVGSHLCRIADHARLVQHHSTWNSEDPDIHVLVLDAEDAEEFREWRQEAPREILPATVVVRKPREWARTTARRVRATLALAIRQRRRELDQTCG